MKFLLNEVKILYLLRKVFFLLTGIWVCGLSFIAVAYRVVWFLDVDKMEFFFFLFWLTCVWQEEIHELLLSFAEAGATVVRLKGGDPLVSIHLELSNVTYFGEAITHYFHGLYGELIMLVVGYL